MRILLVNPPYRVYSTSKTQLFVPRNLLVLASCLLETGFPEDELKIYDMPIEAASLDMLKECVRDFDPDLVGLGIHAAPFIPDASHCVEAIKQAKPWVKIVSGGMLPTNFKERVFELIPGIDAVFSDDAEGSFVQLIQSLQQGESFPDGQVLVSQNTNRKKEINYPLPAYHLIPLDKYRVYYADGETFEEEFAPHLEMMRGCPFPCNFCGVSRDLRLRPIDSIVEEMLFLAEQGFRKLYFTDETFTLIPKRTEELCRRIIQTGEHFRWRCVTRSDSICKNPHLVPLMQKAGCYEVGIGIEVGSQEMLEKLDKNTTLDNQQRATELLQDHGINVNALLVTCSPHETPRDLRRTLEFVALELSPTYSQVFIFHPVPSTVYFDASTDFGLSVQVNELNDWYKWDHTGEPVSDTQHLSRSDIIKYYLLFNHALPTIMNSQEDPELLDRILSNAFPRRHKDVVFQWEGKHAYFYNPDFPEEVLDGNLYKNAIRLIPFRQDEFPAYDGDEPLETISDRLYYEVMLRSNGDFTVQEISDAVGSLFDLDARLAESIVDEILDRFTALSMIHDLEQMSQPA